MTRPCPGELDRGQNSVEDHPISLGVDLLERDIAEDLIRALREVLRWQVLPRGAPVGGYDQTQLRVVQRDALANLEDS